MHLTNYSVNKRSDKYERDEKGAAPSNLGSKRSITWLLEWLRQEKSEAAASKMWTRIGDICVMTILSILPTLRREYAGIFEKKTRPPPNVKESSSDCHASNAIAREMSGTSRCFELLGVDVMIDSTLKPWLIEVNHLPSFRTDTPTDRQVKEKLVADPSLKEELVMDGRITLTLNPHQELCGCQKSGGAPIPSAQMVRCAHLAAIKVEEMHAVLVQALEAAEALRNPEQKKKRQGLPRPKPPG